MTRVRIEAGRRLAPDRLWTHCLLAADRGTLLWITLALLSLALADCPAKAETVVTSTNGSILAAVLGEEGFVGPTVDSDGDVLVKMNGYRVLFIIEREQGSSILAKFSIRCSQANINKVNEFNRGWKYCRAFIDKEGDPVLESDIDLQHGVTEASLREFVLRFSRLMSAFLARVCE